MGECFCGSGEQKWAEYDAQGIFLTYVCDSCRDEKLSKYRPEILTGYTQADVDEPIEPEEW
jgi:hypothetical protein